MPGEICFFFCGSKSLSTTPVSLGLMLFFCGLMVVSSLHAAMYIFFKCIKEIFCVQTAISVLDFECYTSWIHPLFRSGSQGSVPIELGTF